MYGDCKFNHMGSKGRKCTVCGEFGNYYCEIHDRWFCEIDTPKCQRMGFLGVQRQR